MRVLDRMAGLAGLTGGGRNFRRVARRGAKTRRVEVGKGESSNREIGERIERSEA